MRALLNWIRREAELKRLDLRYVRYNEADALIKSDPRWRIAKEEDRNSHIGYVWIEQVEN